jgi:hypothetical protein
MHPRNNEKESTMRHQNKSFVSIWLIAAVGLTLILLLFIPGIRSEEVAAQSNRTTPQFATVVAQTLRALTPSSTRAPSSRRAIKATFRGSINLQSQYKEFEFSASPGSTVVVTLNVAPPSNAECVVRWGIISKDYAWHAGYETLLKGQRRISKAKKLHPTGQRYAVFVEISELTNNRSCPPVYSFSITIQ